MKFIELDSKSIKLMKEHHEVKFYEMILCFSLEELYDSDADTNSEDEIPVTEAQCEGLLNCMVNYLADDYHVSPWHVADAITNLIRKHGAAKTLADCLYDNELLDKELEENF